MWVTTFIPFVTMFCCSTSTTVRNLRSPSFSLLNRTSSRVFACQPLPWLEKNQWNIKIHLTEVITVVRNFYTSVTQTFICKHILPDRYSAPMETVIARCPRWMQVILLFSRQLYLFEATAGSSDIWQWPFTKWICLGFVIILGRDLKLCGNWIAARNGLNL